MGKILIAAALIAIILGAWFLYGGKAQCRNCGFWLSRRAQSCPNCGCKIKKTEHP